MIKMNQEQNNFNSNNFNTQGNNGMPNNQPLNNQGINNTFNQSVYQNTNINQQMYSNQPQSAPNYQQPINQMNMQQPVQPQMNTGYNQQLTNTSVQFNETYNNKKNSLNSSNFPKKSNKKTLITIIVVISLILVGVGIFLLVNKNNAKISIFGDNNITTNDIAQYNLEVDTIWINHSLGIVYNIPKQLQESFFNGTSSFSYLHGSSFEYYSGYKVYVDKSLEGHQNLETLASDIIGEKKSDKYKEVYEFGSSFLKVFDNEKTEQIKINNVDTIYFESQEIKVNDTKNIKFVGYSFKYNGDYISVYGELLVEEESKIEDLKKILQFVIDSIEPHDSRSLQELGGTASKHYDGNYTTKYDDVEKYFEIRYIGSHSLNGIVGVGRYDGCLRINPEYVNWDGTLDGIYKSLKDQKYQWSDLSNKYFPYYYGTDISWIDFETDGLYVKPVDLGTILKEEQITINNIPMKHYLIKSPTNTKYNRYFGGYYSVYTFIFEDAPYVFTYVLDKIYFDEYSEEQLEVFKNQTEVIAKSFMYTISIFEKE